MTPPPQVASVRLTYETLGMDSGVHVWPPSTDWNMGFVPSAHMDSLPASKVSAVRCKGHGCVEFGGDGKKWGGSVQVRGCHGKPPKVRKRGGKRGGKRERERAQCSKRGGYAHTG